MRIDAAPSCASAEQPARAPVEPLSGAARYFMAAAVTTSSGVRGSGIHSDAIRGSGIRPICGSSTYNHSFIRMICYTMPAGQGLSILKRGIRPGAAPAAAAEGARRSVSAGRLYPHSPSGAG